jgi:hypothetical protein
MPDQPNNAIEVHNCWTIYGLNPDGSEATEKLATFSRPQDWGDPKWTYGRYRFEWITSHDGRCYINHCHCWTDLSLEHPSDHPKLFANLIVMIMQPGLPAELCGREYLAEEDFWQSEWGEMPPVYYPPDDPWSIFDWINDEEVEEE